MRLGSPMPLRAASVETEVPYLAAMPPSVSPGRTRWVPPAAAAGAGADPDPPAGTVRRMPIRMSEGFRMPLARARAATVVPCRAAIPPRVSPGRTR